jgi:hypothetical protein
VVSLRLSENSDVSVYGLGRAPVTLSEEQWAKLLDMADEIRAFIKESESKLKTTTMVDSKTDKHCPGSCNACGRSLAAKSRR